RMCHVVGFFLTWAIPSDLCFTSAAGGRAGHAPAGQLVCASQIPTEEMIPFLFYWMDNNITTTIGLSALMGAVSVDWRSTGRGSRRCSIGVISRRACVAHTLSEPTESWMQ
uniref:Uncharacterized protein n=2 Tax=Aegilops tauschii subsp. strangulata TaxID=200361 RepID=A0A453SHD5_AEGTS